jgi:hypothetical protein
MTQKLRANLVRSMQKTSLRRRNPMIKIALLHLKRLIKGSRLGKSNPQSICLRGLQRSESQSAKPKTQNNNFAERSSRKPSLPTSQTKSERWKRKRLGSTFSLSELVSELWPHITKLNLAIALKSVKVWKKRRQFLLWFANFAIGSSLI